MTWTLLLFYGSELLICWRPVTTLFAWVSHSFSLHIWWGGGETERLVSDLSWFFFRDVEVPQSGDWWILGTLKGGYKERSEHCRWRWHDSHITGCLPRTYWCPSAHLQQRVSVTYSFESLKIQWNLPNFKGSLIPISVMIFIFNAFLGKLQ